MSTPTPTVYSIYIPRVLIGLNEEWFIQNFHAIQFGLVKRVDFSPIMDTKTNEERTDIEKVFVHFSEIYRSEYAMEILDNLEQENGVHKVFITPNNFLMLIKNKTPVKDSKLNIHQVADTMRLLYEKALEQDLLLKKQEEMIADLQNTVNELLGKGKKSTEKSTETKKNNTETEKNKKEWISTQNYCMI